MVIIFKKAINEINLSEFNQERLNITGFSLVDYEKQHVIHLITSTVQTTVSARQVKKIPVITY